MKKPLSKLSKSERERYDFAFLSGDEAEFQAAHLGMAAMMGLQKVSFTAGIKRLQLLHVLRSAAKRCPNAAYNLGNYLTDGIRRKTPKRRSLALKLYQRSAEMCVLRLDDAYGDFNPKDDFVNQVKNLLSRSLTNIGAYLANTGRSDEAEDYFRRSIASYPLNDNSFICLGNIGLNQFGQNDVGLLEAIEAWEEGNRLGQELSGFGDDVHPGRLKAKMLRVRIIEVFRRLEEFVGPEIALDWLENKVTTSQWREMGRHGPVPWVVYEPQQVRSVGAETNKWSSEAIEVANVFLRILNGIEFDYLEQAVTFAGSLAIGLARVTSPSFLGSPELVWDAVEDCKEVEICTAFLADGDWEDRAPPQTLYLQSREMEDSIMEAVHTVLKIVVKLNPQANAKDLLMGFFLHLDTSFRHGVASMIETSMEKRPQGLIYIPAMVVGSPELSDD